MKYQTKIKILFITPSFSRGGSEIYLYQLLKNIDKNKFEVFLFSDFPGELTKTKQDYNLDYYNVKVGSLKYYILRVLKKIFKYNYKYRQIAKINQKFKPDIWYLNTSVLQEYVSFAQKLNIPYIVHFHELISVFDGISGNDFSLMINNAKAIIACSKSVKTMIENIRTSNVFVQYEHIEIPDNATVKMDFKKKYNIPEDSFIWLMSGQKCYRKGYDLVPQICNFIKFSKSYLIWLGGSRDFAINQWVAPNKIDNLIEPGMLKGDEYLSVFNSSDGFVLTSREDPFPLVMIEAASHGLPIIAFNSGGVNEFVEDGMGAIIPNFDIDMLCLAMQEVMDGKKLFDKQKSINRAISFDVRVKAKDWEKLIEQIMGIN